LELGEPAETFVRDPAGSLVRTLRIEGFVCIEVRPSPAVMGGDDVQGQFAARLIQQEELGACGHVRQGAELVPVSIHVEETGATTGLGEHDLRVVAVADRTLPDGTTLPEVVSSRPNDDGSAFPLGKGEPTWSRQLAGYVSGGTQVWH
jgi:hypothetical protein